MILVTFKTKSWVSIHTKKYCSYGNEIL